MPNWVYNRVVFTGSSEQMNSVIEAIKEKPRLDSDDNWEEGKSFSFHSFLTPDESVTYEEYHAPNGSGPDGKTGDTPGNWYNWNNNNWHTKWDASQVQISRYIQTRLANGEAVEGLDIRFETAWAPPEPVFNAICERFPDTEISFWYEEEQGWGGTGANANGSYSVSTTWDIPSCHADYVEKDDLDSCWCAQTSDKSDWFDDCPGKDAKPNKYVVNVVSTYSIVAFDEDDAKQAVISHESGYDMPEGSKMLRKEYNIDYTVVLMEEGYKNE